MVLYTHLEVAHVDTVKSDESCVQADICLSEGGAGEIALPGQDLLDPVEGCKHLPHRLVVGLLLGRETRTIHSIVDVPNNVCMADSHQVYHIFSKFI